MCNPAVAVMGLQGMSALYSANAAKQAGIADQAYYNYLAASNERQAKTIKKVAEKQVGLTQDAAAREAVALAREGRRLTGRQKAVLAANGIPLSSVTAEDIAKDTERREDLDQTTIRYNADMKSWETETDAEQRAAALREQARGYRMGGANARRAGDINSFGSILSGATSVASTWYDWRKTSAMSGARTVTEPTAKPRPIYRTTEASAGWNA